MRIARIALVGGSLVLAGVPALGGERVSGPGFDGVVLVDEGPGNWTPTRREIEDLEKALPIDTGKAWSERKNTSPRPLVEYKRQYSGRTQGQRKVIYVTFIHNSTARVRSGEWLQHSVAVAGGGDMYLSAAYDPDANVLLSLRINSAR